MPFPTNEKESDYSPSNFANDEKTLLRKKKAKIAKKPTQNQIPDRIKVGLRLLITSNRKRYSRSRSTGMLFLLSEIEDYFLTGEKEYEKMSEM